MNVIRNLSCVPLIIYFENHIDMHLNIAGTYYLCSGHLHHETGIMIASDENQYYSSSSDPLQLS